MMPVLDVMLVDCLKTKEKFQNEFILVSHIADTK